MIIATVKNKFGYNEQFAFLENNFQKLQDFCKKIDLKILNIRDNEALEVFSIKVN